MSDVKADLNSKEEAFECWACHSCKQPVQPWTYRPRPLGDDDVEIKIQYCGICYSDIHTMDGDWGAALYPVVVGHEIIGIITRKGNGVSDEKFNVGDRVGVGAQVFACHQKDCRECSTGDDPHCPRRVFTYNSVYSDGSRSYGGYSKGIRVSADFAFKIPDALSSPEAAPLLCAGSTVWSPLAEHKVGKGSKVAVVGLGGLGHLAVQFACKLGAEVTVFSHSVSKLDDAKKMGAVDLVSVTDEQKVKSMTSKFDLVLDVAPSNDTNWDLMLNLCRTRGTFVILAAPSTKMSVYPSTLLFKHLNFTGSLIAPPKQIQDMLNFAAANDIHPWIQVYPVEQINDALNKVRAGGARYRCVLEIAKSDR